MPPRHSNNRGGRVTMRGTTPPAEDTAARTARLTAERDQAAAQENRVTTMANVFGNQNGTDDRVYSTDGTDTVVDDGLDEAQRELFAETMEEMDEEVINLGDGAPPNMTFAPQSAAQRAAATRPAPESAEEPAPTSGTRQILRRTSSEEEMQYVDAVANEDLEVSVGHNKGKTFKLVRDRTHRMPIYVVRHLADKGLVRRPQRPW